MTFRARPTDDQALTAKERELAREHWSSALTAASTTERTAFFFDVSLTDDPQFPRSGRPGGTRAMKLFAWATHRRWQQVHGIQIFTRMPDSDDLQNGLNFRQVLLAWIQNLPPEDREALGHGHLELRRVDPEMKDALVAWGTFMEPRMAGVLLERGDAANIRLSIAPFVEWTDAKTGQQRDTFIRVKRPPIDVPSDPPTTPNGQLPERESYIPLERAETGPLDFGAGRVMELPEILAEAARVFGIHYDSDDRLMHTNFFVSGKFSRRSFSDALRVVTSIQPSGESRVIHGNLGAARIGSLAQESFPGLLQEPFLCQQDIAQSPSPLPILPSAFAQGQALTIGELVGDNAGWQRQWESVFGFSPTSVVTLRLGIELEMDAGAADARLIFL